MGNGTESTVNVRKQLVIVDIFMAREILALRCFGNHTQIGKHRDQLRCRVMVKTLNLPFRSQKVRRERRVEVGRKNVRDKGKEGPRCESESERRAGMEGS